jgi:DNA-nicking Smr family endonuclease
MTRNMRPPDYELWEQVRKSVRPLKVLASPQSDVPRAERSIVRTAPAPVPSAEVPVHAARRHASAAPPPLQALDRRTAQKLGRGQVEPEAKLDLHGETLETARMRLLQFLARQRHQGARIVLVITGKGASPFARHTLHGRGHFHAPEREGRLRRELSYWLSEEQFRVHVIGFQPSHPRHGGGGAFYVRLRRYEGGL